MSAHPPLERGTVRGAFTIIGRIARAVGETGNGNRAYMAKCAECGKIHKVLAHDLRSDSKCPKSRRPVGSLRVIIGERFGDIEVTGIGHPTRNAKGELMVSIRCTGCGIAMHDNTLSRLRSKDGPRACRHCCRTGLA